MAESKLRVEDITIGEPAKVMRRVLSRTDLVAYAGASGDYNPMHHDEIKAVEVGLPSVFGHGMFSMGLLTTALEDAVGVGNLTHVKVRFTKQTWPGKALVTSIVPTAIRVDGGRNLVDFEVALAQEVDGTEVVVVSGEATAALVGEETRG